MSAIGLGRTTFLFLAAAVLAAVDGCGLTAPSCRDETGPVFRGTSEVAPGAISSFSVTSPKSSNLVMRLTWPDTSATLGLSATITDCGGHAGCAPITVTPPFGPGGSSPVPQPWPAGFREMHVDGWQGKTWRVDVTGDPARTAAFTLDVAYVIQCES